VSTPVAFNVAPSSCFELSLVAAQYRGAAIYQSFVTLNREISLLHPDVLALLYHFGAHSISPILELGPFMGGSTIAIARGCVDSGKGLKVVTVECGGIFEHPTHASGDIVASLRSNLEKHGLTAQTELIVGNSREAATVEQVSKFAATKPFGCLVIDSDGKVKSDIQLYRSMLSPHAYLIVDDYYAPGNPEKEATTRGDIDELVQQGAIDPFGVHGWGTWFGRFL